MELLSCPLCLNPHFQGVDDLRSSLITIATSQICCPVCNDTLMGLDKLTIHLFSHITHNLVQQSLNNSLTMVERVIDSRKNECHGRKGDDVPIEKSTDLENYANVIEESILTIPKDCPTAKTVRCDICNFYFSDENILEMHQKLLHQTQVDVKTGQCNYHCHLCSKKFKMKGSLMVHLRVAHYGFAKQDSENSSDKNSLQPNDPFKNNEKNDKLNDGKQWICDVCSKQFTTKYFLKKHKRLHTGEMPYFCAQCNKSFTFQQSYHKHMLYHSSEKPHLCSECGRAFKELSTLHNHERIHSGERPFVCETCGKSFRQRVSYLVHRRIHTGVMPYKCTACDKSFRYKISQKSHRCPANPPGSVVRALVVPEEPIEKTLGETPSIPNSSKISSNQTTLSDQNYTSTLYPQQQTQNFENKMLNCLNKVEHTGAHLKNGNSNLVALENNGKITNHVNTIIFNSDGQIIGQNFAFDGQNIIAVPPKFIINGCTSSVGMTNQNEKYTESGDSSQATQINKDQLSMVYEQNNNKSPDFFSMVLSPMIPDVQSLCLSSSPTSDNEDRCVKQEPLETINEESFKSLLDGLSNCI